MFSTEASTQSARSSLRHSNPRRRQRTSEGAPQQQPVRKRSKLSDTSFAVKDEAHVNGNGSVLTNGHADHGSAENSLVVVDMPVREKTPKRATKEDAASYLTKNANYSLRRIPGFPTPLLQPSVSYTATALPSAGLTLVLTHDRARVWEIHTEITPKVVTLSLPFNLRASDPLPLGAIVRNGPSNDFGVVAIAPSTGKIAFWENIDSTYAQRQHGVEGTVKLYSGEVITDVVDIEHAGYVLVSSSGRLAHMTLRDAQGRPSITTSMLSAPHSSNGSFFSLKGLLGGAMRKNIASVKARPSDHKGHMEATTVTRTGLFQQWDLSWSGQNSFIRELDVQTQIAAAVREGDSPESRNLREVQVLDFAIMGQQNSSDTLSLVVLVASVGRSACDYSLLEVDLSSTGSTISRAIPIRNFQQPHVPSEPTGTLLIPRPGHTAFILFPEAICVASLARPEESPESQMLLDSGRSTLPFQDSIYFRGNLGVVVNGHALEHGSRKDNRANALIFVQHVGILQLSAQPPTTDNRDDDRTRVTARSKLEQATLFSTGPGRLLDFSIKSRFSFPDEEVAQAALDVSSNILSSSYSTLDKATSSMNDHFKSRASALRTLNSYLQSDYPPLPYRTKWRLLWHAEKLAAAHQLWLWYQDKIQDQKLHPESYPDKILMADIVMALNERYKTPLQSDLGETDSIRQFFLKDIDTLNILIPWGWFFLRTYYIKDGVREQAPVMQRLSEGTDVMLVTLETAFKFRQENIESYGLDKDILEDGILKPGRGYDMLPHFWTSSHNIVSSIRSLVDVGRNLAVSNFEEEVLEGLSKTIASVNPRLVKIGCQTHMERFQWALEQNDEKWREMGLSLKTEWDTNVRPQHIMGLMEIGLPTEGMTLAELYYDMPTLVDLVWDETQWLEDQKANTRSKMEVAESNVKLNRIKERIGRYFEIYGDDWANAFYSKYINENRAAQLFSKEYLNQPALTGFLEAEPSRARLRWINEVIGEKNYDSAGICLYDAATQQETNAWCQRVELSIAKLAMLCNDKAEDDAAPAPPVQAPEQRSGSQKAHEFYPPKIEDQLEYAKIQEEVYERLLPTITGALDDEGAVELLMDQFGQGRLRDRPAHQSILRQGFEDLIQHKVIDPTLMIDILTLMNGSEKEEISSLLQSNEFLFAFRVLFIHYNRFKKSTAEDLYKLIWKRLCLKDSWEEINNTKDMSDAELRNYLLDTSLGWTIKGLKQLMAGKGKRKYMPPRNIDFALGAGAVDSELCIRFSNEDLRKPIIHDNVMDDDILKAHLENNRLAEWYAETCRAGIEEFERECAELEEAMRHDVQENGHSHQVDESVRFENADVEEEEAPAVAGSDTFEGDIESGADQDRDVEMVEA